MFGNSKTCVQKFWTVDHCVSNKSATFFFLQSFKTFFACLCTIWFQDKLYELAQHHYKET